MRRLQSTLAHQMPSEAIAYYSLLRSLIYFAEFLPLQLIHQALFKKQVEKPPKDHLEVLFEELRDLYIRDAENIKRGVYGLDLLTPGSPLRHVKNYIKVLKDGLAISRRKKVNDKANFSQEASRFLEDVPEYYQRNFHFQTDGYLSQKSADIYDLQVDLLFRGSGQAMRRMILPALHQFLVLRDKSDRKVLEFGCGVGTASELVLKTFNSLELTCLDLSDPYLKAAQDRLKKFKNVCYVRGAAEETDFKNDVFGAVYTVYMLHELPAEVRQRVCDEAFRVLKPGGIFIACDSLQKGDNSKLDWSLDAFPKDFHEPFYKNYTESPLKPLLAKSGFVDLLETKGFLTKVVFGYKPMSKNN